MLTLLLTRLVRFSVRHAWTVIGAALLLVIVSGAYVARHFAIDTDMGRLLDATAPWARRDAAVDKAFPQRQQNILAVVQAPAPELADAAATELAGELRRQPARFRAVDQPGGGDYFARAGLLFLPPDKVDQFVTQLLQARPLINTLAHDPTLRGLADTLSVTLALPLQSGQVKLGDMAGLLDDSAAAIEQVLAGKPAALSWIARAVPQAARPASAGMANSFVTISPVLDYRHIQAGAEAAAAVRASASRLGLAQRFGATVRLTGAQPLTDEEFASVKEGALLNGVLTVLAVVLILWLALRSGKLVLAVLINLFAGLIVTAALGLAMVGALNMISVAFAVLFVGLGADFGIQFGVRYRAERHAGGSLPAALAQAARAAGVPLALAAAATAVAFFSFLPTAYRGVGELGLIAGAGMLVAFASTLTLLPALIAVLRPHGESQPPTMRALAPADWFFERHRKAILLLTCALILAGAPLLPHLRFDFDPLHLKNPQSESMATLLSLENAAEAGIDNVNVLAPSLAAARTSAARLAALPEVARVVTLESFIPDRQAPKLARIAAGAASLEPVLGQRAASPASDALRSAALARLADQLELAAEDYPGAGAAASARLAKAVRRLAGADAATRDRAEQAIALPLQLALARLRLALQAQPVGLQQLPPALVRDWLTADGRALVSVSPRLPPPGDPARPAALRRFEQAVQQAEPAASGGPISVRGSADIIMTAFAQAAGWALLSITVVLWITLRNFGDVLRTLLPLLVSTIVTLELCVVFGISLNFANVIALPLLLGIGVAFKIYYVMAWRAGHTHLLQSSLTLAVLYSAATTAAAFGSLSFSHHPGTASMGKLLALALGCTLLGAVFFQPILLGRPRLPQPPTPGDVPDRARPSRRDAGSAQDSVAASPSNHFTGGFPMNLTNCFQRASKPSWLRAAPLLMLSALLGGCASGPNANPADPLEPLNRTVFKVNDKIDTYVAVPLAKGYRDVTPTPVRTAVTNFFGNLGEIGNTVNNLAQGKGTDTVTSVMRFAVNTVFGIGGLIDIATPAGLRKQSQDVGLTLGYWGVPPGPYLVLPLFGPSSFRDGAGLAADFRLDPVTYAEPALRNSLYGLQFVNTRTNLLGATELLEQAALDKYSFVRDGYLQRRQSMIERSNGPRKLPEYEDGGAAPPAEGADVATPVKAPPE